MKPVPEIRFSFFVTPPFTGFRNQTSQFVPLTFSVTGTVSVKKTTQRVNWSIWAEQITWLKTKHATKANFIILIARDSWLI